MITRYPLADPADLPDLDRAYPAGLCWRAPLDSRPILLGETAPTLLPALAIDGGRYWRGAEDGRQEARAGQLLRAEADAIALQPAPTTGEVPLVALAQAGADYLRALEVAR